MKISITKRMRLDPTTIIIPCQPLNDQPSLYKVQTT